MVDSFSLPGTTQQHSGPDLQEAWESMRGGLTEESGDNPTSNAATSAKDKAGNCPGQCESSWPNANGATDTGEAVPWRAKGVEPATRAGEDKQPHFYWTWTWTWT